MAVHPIRVEGFLGGAQGQHLFLPVEFVRLGQQNVYRQLAMPYPFYQGVIEFKQTSTTVDDQYCAYQTWPFGQVTAQLFVPYALTGLGQLRKTVARKVDEACNRLCLLNDMKEVEKLGAAGHFTGIGQLPLFAQGVNGRGLAGV